MHIRIAEFCAGVGGFRLGIALSNMDASVVYANEIDANCEKTYAKNFGKGFDSRNIFDVDESMYRFSKKMEAPSSMHTKSEAQNQTRKT